VANERTTFAEAFKMADDVLASGVRGVTDLMVQPGLINLDFADIRAVMSEMGKAMMGTGEAEGDPPLDRCRRGRDLEPAAGGRIHEGARAACSSTSPAGLDMTLFEVDEAANRIREEVDPDANIIFGSTFDEKLEGKMRISVGGDGIDLEGVREPRPVPVIKHLVSDRSRDAKAHAAARAGRCAGQCRSSPRRRGRRRRARAAASRGSRAGRRPERRLRAADSGRAARARPVVVAPAPMPPAPPPEARRAPWPNPRPACRASSSA